MMAPPLVAAIAVVADLIVVVRRKSEEIRAPLALPEKVHVEVEGSRWRVNGRGARPEGKPN